MPFLKASPLKVFKTQSPACSPEGLVRRYVDQFAEHNRAAKVLMNDLRVIGVGLRPLIDHISFLTQDIRKRAAEFTACGYRYKSGPWHLKAHCWQARVYCLAGYPSVIFFEPFEHKGCIEKWLHAFNEEIPHHVAVKVDNLENGVFYLEKQGIPFAGNIIGSKDAKLRQVFTAPEAKDGRPYTALELTERHAGYEGFIATQMQDLMKSFFGNH
jgi:hypothetical protein